MTYVNSAVGRVLPPLPVEEYHVDTPLEKYDLNFCFPVKVLESNAVRLEPFIPSVHGKEAWEVFNSQHGVDMYKYIPFNRPTTWPEFLTHQEKQRRNTTWQEFAIIDKTRRSGPRLAGMISMINSSAEQLVSELGAVFVFPDSQRTHVNTHAAGLLLQYALEDLKLRRMQWRANDLNEPSVRAAKRLGFLYEGTMQWDRVLPQGKVGRTVSSQQEYGRPEAGPGRHSAQLVITWEGWSEGVRDHVQSLKARQVLFRD